MTKLILAAFAAAALFAVTSSANAGSGVGCPIWMCGSNGTQITGIALGSASTGTVHAVILPSGEIVDLR